MTTPLTTPEAFYIAFLLIAAVLGFARGMGAHLTEED